MKPNLILAIFLNVGHFNTDKPILQSLFEHAQNNFGKLEDRYFENALAEYNMDEETVMKEMTNSKEYKFTRYATGWNVKEK